MAMLHVDIVSAEESLYSGEGEMVFAPAEQGEVGIAPEHAPLLTRLVPGEVRVLTPEGMQSFFVSSGILEIQPSVVTILSDVAERAADIDEHAALEAKRRAEATLAERRKDEVDLVRAQAELAEALARLHLIQRQRERNQRR